MVRDRLIAWLKKWRTGKCAECMVTSLLALSEEFRGELLKDLVAG